MAIELIEMTDTDKTLARTAKLTRRRPPAPREVSFQAEGNLLTWKAPADKKLYTHFRVRVGTDGGAPDFELSAGQLSLQIPQQAQTFFVSTYNSANGLESPKISVSGQTGVVGDDYAPSVTSFTSVIETRVSDGGNAEWRYTLTWLEPTTDWRFPLTKSYAVIFEWPGVKRERIVELPKGSTGYVSDWRATPAEGTTETYYVWLPTRSITDKENALVAGITPRTTLIVQYSPGGTGVEYTANVSLGTITVQYPTTDDGTHPARIIATFTPPASATWSRAELFAYYSSVMTPLNASAASSPVIATGPAPDTVQVWTIYVVSRDKSGRLNSIDLSTTPHANINIGSASGMLNGAKLVASSVSTIRLDAEGIAVGGGGGKPGEVSVANASGTQFGFIGMFGKRTGVVSTSGTFVGRISGDIFVPEMNGMPISINGVVYTVAAAGYVDASNLVLTGSAGSQSLVGYIGWTGQGIWGSELRAGGTTPWNAPLVANSTGLALTDTGGIPFSLTLTSSGGTSYELTAANGFRAHIGTSPTNLAYAVFNDQGMAADFTYTTQHWASTYYNAGFSCHYDAGVSILGKVSAVIAAGSATFWVGYDTSKYLQIIANVTECLVNVASGYYCVEGTKVLGTRRTGWTAATGTADRTAFDTATVTVENLAKRVKAMLDDLIAHGALGS